MNRTPRKLQVESLEDRTTPSYTLDTTFGNAGSVTIPLGQSVESSSQIGIEPSGRIVVLTQLAYNSNTNGDETFPPGENPAGYIPPPGEILGLSPGGALDPTFGTAGRIVLPTNATGVDLVVSPTGMIYVATTVGTTSTVDRFNPDGTPDTSYGSDGMVTLTNGGAGFSAEQIALQPDGKLLVVGVGPQWTSEYLVARLNPDGSLDATFNGDGMFQHSFPSQWNVASNLVVAVATDGTILLSGELEGVPIPVPGEATPNVIAGSHVSMELNPDGTLDTHYFGTGIDSPSGAFPTPEGVPGDNIGGATELLAEPDDTILELNGGEIFRVNLDGSLDTSFVNQGAEPPAPPGVTPTTEPVAMVLLPNGQFAVETVGLTQALVSIFNADGSPANAFLGGAESLPIDLGGRNPDDFSDFVGGFAVSLNGQIVVAATQSGATALKATSLVLAQLVDSNVTPPAPSFQVPAGDTLVTADVNDDGTLDGVLVGQGTIKVINGKDLSTLVAPFSPFPGYTGTLSVATGDISQDGAADIVVAAGTGGGPVVAVYDGAKLSGGDTPTSALIVEFLGIDEPDFRGGARVAVGDVNGDGVPDLVVAAGDGGGPRVAIYDGKSVAAGTPTKLVNDFFAFDPSLRSGASVAVGTISNAQYGDLIFGAGVGGGPQVKVISGYELVGMQDTSGAFNDPIASFFAGDPYSRDGAQVSTVSVSGQIQDNILVTPQVPGTKPLVFPGPTISLGFANGLVGPYPDPPPAVAETNVG
jgi:uncharacterized delta-60 repeat protein